MSLINSVPRHAPISTSEEDCHLTVWIFPNGNTCYPDFANLQPVVVVGGFDFLFRCKQKAIIIVFIIHWTVVSQTDSAGVLFVRTLNFKRFVSGFFDGTSSYVVPIGNCFAVRDPVKSRNSNDYIFMASNCSQTG